MFTDSCPSCVRRGCRPHAEKVRGGCIAHGYRCPACGHVWATARLLAAYSTSTQRRAA